MSNRLWLLATALLGLASFAPTAMAAEGAEPPLEVLFAKQNMLVAGKLLETHPSGLLVFAFDDLLSGKTRPPARIEIHAPIQALDRARVGTRYVFAYSLYKSDPNIRELLQLNPRGGVMLVAAGLEPALFTDSRELRAILRAGKEEENEKEEKKAKEETRSDEHGAEGKRLWRRLLKALASEDSALQDLAANQIAIDRDLLDHAQKRDQTVVRNFVLDRDAPPSARRALLVSAWQNPQQLGDWWKDTARVVLETTPIGGYDSKALDPSELVLAAFDMLAASDTALTPKLVSRWIESDTPLLAEKALLTIRQLEPTRERVVIREALANPGLSAQTRKFLDDHLRRLNLLDARLREQKEGSH